ncbi:MAG: glycogen/starch synthase [Dysgonamonadaceae bacterium]
MNKKRILYISQEIYPYSPKTTVSNISRFLPQAIQEKGKEIRSFMPKYGNINERRNQLHEVIRLSGMNLIIDDTDHSLIIKVASIQPARMQIYFIDNDDFFQHRETVVDENGVEYMDNDERSIFFTRGVMETVKKLRWIPDVIHCHGWFSALVPLFIKRGYADDPTFKDSKVVYSVYDDAFNNPFHEEIAKKLLFEGIDETEIKSINERGTMDFENLTKMAIDYSDAVVQGSENINSNISKYITEKNIDFTPYNVDFDSNVNEIDALYDKLKA